MPCHNKLIPNGIANGSVQVEEENTNQHGQIVCVRLDVVSVFFLYPNKIPQRRSAK